MTSGWVFLGIGTVVAAVDLAIAHFAAGALRRRAEAPPMDGARPAPSAAGIRIFRLGAVVIFLIFAAMAFGVIPLANVQPISFH